MARDFLLSVALHVGILALTLLASPFDINSTPDDMEVIAVDVLFENPPAAAETVKEETVEEPVSIKQPEPAIEEPEEIPISEPETNDEEAVIEEEPKVEEPPEPKEPPRESVVEQPVQESPPPQETGPSEIHSTVTGEGAVFAGATINNASFEYPYWFTQAFNKILRNWRNPVASDAVLVCTIYFEVIKSGRVIVKRIETSSGVKPFDEACLAAISKSDPFPPLPRQFADEIIGITLPFKGVPGR